MLDGEGENDEQIIFHGADSSVVIIPGAPTVTKEYPLLSKAELRDYAKLHHLLSQESGLIECSDKLRAFFGISLQRIKFQFLDLGENIISEGGSSVHIIPYVPGDRVDIGLSKYITCTRAHVNALIEWIGTKISEYIAEKLRITPYIKHDVTSPHVVGCNMKIVSFEGNVLSLIVTDIGSSILALLEENRQAIDQILSEKQ